MPTRVLLIDDDARLAEMLGPAFEACFGQGDFRVSKDPDCGYCDFKAACDRGPAVAKRLRLAEGGRP